MGLAFAQAGARIIVASRKIESCEITVEEKRSQRGDAFAVASHVGDWDGLKVLVEKSSEHFGKVDVLFDTIIGDMNFIANAENRVH